MTSFAATFVGLLTEATRSRARHAKPVASWSVVQRTPTDRYRRKPADVIKLSFSTHAAAVACRRALQTPNWMDARVLSMLIGKTEAAAKEALAAGDLTGWYVRTAEGGVEPGARFMIEAGLHPECWLTWPGGAPAGRGERLTTCALEKHITWEQLLRCRSERPGYTPKKVTSLAVEEVAGRVAACVMVSLRQDAPAERTVTRVEASDEGALLTALNKKLVALDPDVMVTFGGRRVDWRLLQAGYARAEQAPFEGWSRLSAVAAGSRSDMADSARVTFECPGRCEFDVQAWMQRNQASIKARSYDLEDVARDLLDRPPAVGPEERAQLMLDLLFTAAPRNKAFHALLKELSYAAASGAPSADICAGCGTQKVLRQKLMRVARARPERFVLVDAPPRPPADSTKRKRGGDDDDDEGGFAGGKVLDAKAALYGPDRPVAVFDFGSLYPSIMMERNICVTARIQLADAQKRGIPLAEVPPCPWTQGTWLADDGQAHRLGDALPPGAVMHADGFELTLADGTVWRRCPSTVLAFVAKVRSIHSNRALQPALLFSRGEGHPPTDPPPRPSAARRMDPDPYRPSLFTLFIYPDNI